MTTIVTIGLAAVAVACPAHMLWCMLKGKRTGCISAEERPASAFAERQRALAERIETLAKAEPASDGH